MKPLAFFRTPEVARLLTRIARCGAAVSLHAVEDGKEGVRITGDGACAACSYVARLPGGKSACRRSREAVLADALRLHTMMPFFCHMGFACITVFPLPGDAPGFALTFGPYCPAEGAGSLVSDACDGLARFHAAPDSAFSKAIADVPVFPAKTVPGLIEWTLDELRLLWAEAQRPHESEQPAANTEVQAKPARRAKTHPPSADPYQARPIAAALAGGAQGQARALVRAVLSETTSEKRAHIAVRRTRALALAGAILEASERAGMDTAVCRAQFPAFMEELEKGRTDVHVADAVMRLISILKRKAAREVAKTGDYAELNAILIPRLAESITLNEVATTLGQNPTAITHRLQRKFGMSYSEYVGRLRIDKAKELLRRTRLSVTEVARRVGVNDNSNFAKLFQKFEAMSPLKYREQFGRRP